MFGLLVVFISIAILVYHFQTGDIFSLLISWVVIDHEVIQS